MVLGLRTVDGDKITYLHHRQFCYLLTTYSYVIIQKLSILIITLKGIELRI